MATKKRSIVWSYFMRSSDKSTTANCILCGTGIVFSNTSNLLDHLRSRHHSAMKHLWNKDVIADVKPLESPGIRKYRSIVWTCFEKLDADDPGSAFCSLCGKKFRYLGSSTSNLRKHLLSRHPAEYESMMSDRAVRVAEEAVVTNLAASKKSRRRKRSILWGYFTKSSTDAGEVLCGFCGRTLKQTLGSTSNLAKHLYAKHRKEYRKIFCAGNDDPADEDGGTDVSLETAVQSDTNQISGQSISETEQSVTGVDAPASSLDVGAGTRRGIKPRSVLWRYFVKNLKDPTQVLCNFCGRMFKQPVGSMSNLVKHLLAIHPDEYYAIYPEEEAKARSGDCNGISLIRLEGSKEQMTNLSLTISCESIPETERDDAVLPSLVDDAGARLTKTNHSVLWDLFVKSSSYASHVECGICGQLLKHAVGDTSNVVKHLFATHKKEYNKMFCEEEEEEEDVHADEDGGNYFSLETTVGPRTNLISGQSVSETKQAVSSLGIDSSVTRLDFGAGTRSKSKPRSILWQYFVKNSKDPTRILCNFCGRMLKQPVGSMSNLVKHLLARHRDEYHAIYPEEEMKEDDCAIASPVGGGITGSRKNRSSMWKFFVKNSKDPSQVVCNFCGRLLKQPVGSTSNLVKHLHARHRMEYCKLYPGEAEERVAAAEEDCQTDDPLGSTVDGLNSSMILQLVQTSEWKPGGSTSGNEEVPEEEEDENGEESGSGLSIPDMCSKVLNIWQSHCEEREREFQTEMKKRRKELRNAQESMEKLRLQMALLSDDVRRLVSKRKLELERQEEMDPNFLTQKEAECRKEKYRKNLDRQCALAEGILGEISLTNSKIRAEECASQSERVVSSDGHHDPMNNAADSTNADTVAMETSSLDTTRDVRGDLMVTLNENGGDGWTCNV